MGPGAQPSCAEGRRDREEIHDDRLERQDDRAEQQEEHEHRRRHDVDDRDRRAPHDVVHGVEVDRGEPADHLFGAGRRRDRADRSDDVPRFVAVRGKRCDDVEQHDVRAHRLRQECLDLRRQLRPWLRIEGGVVRRLQARIEGHRTVHPLHVRHLGDALRELGQRRNAVGCEWIATRVVHDDADVRDVRAREVGAELVVRGARFLFRRQHRDVARRQAEPQERRSRQKDERDDRQQDDDRSAHDRGRDRVPPTAPACVRLEDRHAKPVDVRPEDREERGEEREPVEDRARDDDRSRDAHRGQERPLVEEHPGETDGDGEPGEGDRAT